MPEELGGGNGLLPAVRTVLQRLSASNAPNQARATGMRGVLASGFITVDDLGP